MAKKRTITITVETDQLLIVRKSKRVHAWCVGCTEQTEHTTLGEAAMPTNQNLEQLPVTIDLHPVSKGKD